jgi:predicted thioesterase
MSVADIRPGLRGERQVVVSQAMTTAHVGGRRILTAPALIMEMELTAQAVTEPLLPPGLTTVGYEIAIRHRRPTPLGERFSVLAELREVEGNHLLFTVEAYNSREKIGEGTLRRTIIRRGALS